MAEVTSGFPFEWVFAWISLWDNADRGFPIWLLVCLMYMYMRISLQETSNRGFPIERMMMEFHAAILYCHVSLELKYTAITWPRATFRMNCFCFLPQFPWVLKDYDSPTIDLNDSKIYRDFSKPMGCQSEQQQELAMERSVYPPICTYVCESVYPICHQSVCQSICSSFHQSVC